MTATLTDLFLVLLIGAGVGAVVWGACLVIAFVIEVRRR